MNIRKLFTRPENYTAMDEMSPADRAKQTWDNRDGSVIIQNYNLRLLNIGQLAVNVILVGALIFSSMKSSVQPFVVFANPQNGEVWHVGTAAEAQNFEPTEEMKRYFMLTSSRIREKFRSILSCTRRICFRRIIL